MHTSGRDLSIIGPHKLVECDKFLICIGNSMGASKIKC